MLQLDQIAKRISELRDILDISAEKVAEDIGIDVETYERYEKAEEDIPIGKLYLIANVLGCDPTVLLSGDSPRMVDYTIVRNENGMDVERYKGYRFSALAYNYVGREMEPMVVTLDPDGKIPELVHHEGQEFNYVIDGSIIVTIGSREFKLDRGDSIYFDPRLPHGQRAADGKTAKFLTVINELKK